MHTQLREPHISTIPLACHRIGYMATTMRLKSGTGHHRRRKISPCEELHIPPLPVISRRSSDIVAADDPFIRDAAANIRDHLHEGLNVKQLSCAMKVSRTTLETRFKAVLRRQPAEEVRRKRMERAKTLLSSSKITVGEIASKVGFGSAQLFSEPFRRFERRPH